MRHYFALIYSVFIFAGLSATAQIRVAPSPTWLLPIEQKYPIPNSKTIKDGFYEILFENQEQIEFQEDYMHIIRKIVSNEGVQYGSQVSVAFDPSYQQLIFHKIVVRRRGEEMNKLSVPKFKVEAIEQDLSKFIYNGIKNAFIILDDVRKGDEIEYAYTLKGRNPIMNGKYFGTIYTISGSPIGLLFQAIICSQNRKLNFKENNAAPKAKVVEGNGMMSYSWVQELPPLYDYEDYTPSWYEDKPHVQVTEISNWASLGDWALPLYPVTGVLSKDLQLKVVDWKNKSAGDALKFMQMATQFVQDEIRYMGIEVGGNSHKPNAPEKVFRQRFGDCKDKTLLLCNILKSNGIEAYPALVNTYKTRKLDELLPSPFDFNHVITVAYINGKDYWIDATIANQRGEIPSLYLPQYGKAFIIKAKESKLTNIPIKNAGKSIVVETYTIPSIGGDGKLKVKSEYDKSVADDMRSVFANSAIADIEVAYTDFYAGLFPKNQLTLSDSLIFIDSAGDNIFKTTEYYSISDFWGNIDSTSKKYEIQVYGKLLLDKLRYLKSTSKARKAPIDILYPFESDYTINIEFPESWGVKDETFSIERDAYQFSYSAIYDPADNVWSLHCTYKALQDYVAADKVAEYNADLLKMESLLSKSITWNPNLDEMAGSNTNWWMVIFGMTIAGLCGFAGIRYYKQSLANNHTQTALPIGGWLILVAIGLIISPCFTLYNIFNSDFFKASNWDAAENFGAYGHIFQIWFTFELFYYIVIFVFAILNLFLFFKQRDTLPRSITAMYLCIVVFFSIDYVLSIMFASQFSSFPIDTSAKDLVRSIVAAFIWIPYFNRSTRVKETFVYPYKREFFYDDSTDNEEIITELMSQKEITTNNESNFKNLTIGHPEDEEHIT